MKKEDILKSEISSGQSTIRISTDCPRYDDCARAIPTDGIQQTINYISYGSGSSNGEISWACGPMGDYKMHIPVDHDR